MSDVIPYPINFETKGITGRDGYIVAEARYFATGLTRCQTKCGHHPTSATFCEY